MGGELSWLPDAIRGPQSIPGSLLAGLFETPQMLYGCDPQGLLVALLESHEDNGGREGKATSTSLGLPWGRAAAGTLSSHPPSARLLQGC